MVYTYIYTTYIPIYPWASNFINLMNHQQSVRLCKLSDEGSSSRSSGMMVSFRSDLSGVMRGPIWPKFGALGDMVRRSANRKRPCTTLGLGVIKLPSHQQLSWILRDSTPKFAHLRCKNGCSGQPRGVSSLGKLPPDIASPLPPAESHSTGRIWSSETAWCLVFPENGISPGRKDAKWD